MSLKIFTTKKYLLVCTLELCVEENTLVHQNSHILSRRPLSHVRKTRMQKRVNLSQAEVPIQLQHACRPVGFTTHAISI